MIMNVIFAFTLSLALALALAGGPTVRAAGPYDGWRHGASIFLVTTADGAGLPAGEVVHDFLRAAADRHHADLAVDALDAAAGDEARAPENLARLARAVFHGLRRLHLEEGKIAGLGALGIDVGRAQITRDAPDWFHPGKSGVIRLGPKLVLAQFGEIHPATLKAFDLDGPVAAFEIFLSALPPEKKKSRARAPLDVSDLMAVKRDFAFVVSADTEAGDIVRAAAGADKALIEDVSVFDVYEGKALGEGKKSVAIEIALQPKDRTLTDQEIDTVSEKIVAAVSKATGAVIRG